MTFDEWLEQQDANLHSVCEVNLLKLVRAYRKLHALPYARLSGRPPAPPSWNRQLADIAALEAALMGQEK